MRFQAFFLLGCLIFISGGWLIEQAAGNQISYAVSDYEYVFKSGTASPKLWTTVVTRRITESDSSPSAVSNDDTLRIYSAANELESFQIVVDKTGKSDVTVDYPSSFAGSSVGLSCGETGFSTVSAWGQGNYKVADTVTPFASGASVSLSSSHPTVLFCTASVPADTTGKTTYTATIGVTVSGNARVTISVELYVFNFALTTTSPFQTYFQSTPTTSLGSYSLSDLDAFKAVYLQHHWNYRDTAWSGGFKAWSGGSQDSSNSYWDPSSHTLVDADPATSSTSCVWANGCLGLRYSTGKSQTWDGVTTGTWQNGDGGFSVWEYANVEDGRPDPFDGVSCGTNPGYDDSQWRGWMCSSAYEDEFGKYLRALESFTSTNQLNSAALTRAFFYTINEPQSYNDYTVAAYLCKTANAQAPTLPLMLTREAHPWITDRADSLSCGYDIWVAHVSRFPADITWDRQVNHGETSWLYSLDTDNECAVATSSTCDNCVCNPAFAPFVSQTGDNGAENPRALNEGMHYRVIPWVAWANRVTGWGYYKDSVCWTQANRASIAPVLPTIAATLIREGIDDYAYLWAANSRSHADPYTYVAVDDAAVSVGFGVYAWNNDPYALQALRNELGRFVEGSRGDVPYLTQPFVHPYADYNLDFGPYGLSGNNYGEGTSFTDSDGLEWLGIGFPAYDAARGYGWNSYMTGVPNTIQKGNPVLHCQDTQAGLGTVADTVCYDDYNHVSTFFFALAAGDYEVFVGIGWPTKTRNDVEYVRVNNVVLRNYTCNDDCVSVREYSGTITVRPHSNGATLVMTVGSPFVNDYTILNYLKIRATGPTTKFTGTTTQSSRTSSSSVTQTTTSRTDDDFSAAAFLALPTLFLFFALSFFFLQ